jgi:hypothetical protein
MARNKKLLLYVLLAIGAIVLLKPGELFVIHDAQWEIDTPYIDNDILKFPTRDLGVDDRVGFFCTYRTDIQGANNWNDVSACTNTYFDTRHNSWSYATTTKDNKEWKTYQLDVSGYNNIEIACWVGRGCAGKSYITDKVRAVLQQDPGWVEEPGNGINLCNPSDQVMVDHWIVGLKGKNNLGPTVDYCEMQDLFIDIAYEGQLLSIYEPTYFVIAPTSTADPGGGYKPFKVWQWTDLGGDDLPVEIPEECTTNDDCTIICPGGDELFVECVNSACAQPSESCPEDLPDDEIPDDLTETPEESSGGDVTTGDETSPLITPLGTETGYTTLIILGIIGLIIYLIIKK